MHARVDSEVLAMFDQDAYKFRGGGGRVSEGAGGGKEVAPRNAAL
jgi:hypothetical protein